MTPAVRNAIVALFIVGVLIGAANLLFTAHYVNATRAAQQRQGEMVEHKICASFGKLAALKPPAGNPAANPSRAFDQRQHVILDELGGDLGCPP